MSPIRLLLTEHRGFAVWLGALLVAATPSPAAMAPSSDEPARYVDRPLSEVLLELQEEGLPLVFTSEVVRPGMRVENEPGEGDPATIVEEILAPHGLAIREGAGGVLVVVPIADSMPPRGDEPAAFERGRPWIEDEILVQPSRLSLLEEEPEGPFTLSRDEIARLPHLGGDVFRAMPLAPGTATNDVTAGFHVRGGRRDEVLVQLDGQELYEPYHLKDFDSALSIVPTDTLASVTLTTGGFPVSRGDRMGGVLDLRTESPTGPWTTRLGVGLLSAVGTSAGALPRDRGGWVVTARRGSAELARSLLGEEEPSFWDAFGKVDLRPRPGHRLIAHVLRASDTFDFRESIDEETKLFETEYDSGYGWVSHEGLVGRSLLVESAASWAEVWRDRRGAELEEDGFFEVRDERRMEVMGLRQSLSLQSGPNHRLLIGWEARRFDASFDYENLLERELVVAAPFSPEREPLRRFEGELRTDHGASWVSYRWSGRDRLTAEGGLRWDRHSLTDETLWSPRLNLAWRVGKRNLLRGSWGRFHQSQRPYELQVEDGEILLQGAERSDHWVLGYEHRLEEAGVGPTAVRVEAFHRRIGDPRTRWVNLLEPINEFPEIEPDRVRIAPEESSAYGLELLLRGTPRERLSWWLAYTWSRTEDLVDGRYAPRLFDQPHALVLDLSYRLGPRWDLNAAWHVHTGWPTTPVHAVELVEDDEPELGLELGSLNSERLPTYHRLDLRLSRSWSTSRSDWSFFVDVQNAYDRKNTGGFDPDLDEETGTVVLDPEAWPGILPSFGVLVEF